MRQLTSLFRLSGVRRMHICQGRRFSISSNSACDKTVDKQSADTPSSWTNQKFSSGEAKPFNPRESPIKFSTSGASEYNTAKSFINVKAKKERMPMWKLVVYAATSTVVLLYVMFVRQDTDTDGKVNAEYYKMFPDAELTDLKAKIRTRKWLGRETELEERRMIEILGKDHWRVKTSKYND